MKLSPEQCMRALFLFSWAITETLAQAAPTESALPSPSAPPVINRGSSQRDIRIAQAQVYGMLILWLLSTLGVALYMDYRNSRRRTLAYDEIINNAPPLPHTLSINESPASQDPDEADSLVPNLR